MTLSLGDLIGALQRIQDEHGETDVLVVLPHTGERMVATAAQWNDLLDAAVIEVAL